MSIHGRGPLHASRSSSCHCARMSGGRREKFAECLERPYGCGPRRSHECPLAICGNPHVVLQGHVQQGLILGRQVPIVDAQVSCGDLHLPQVGETRTATWPPMDVRSWSVICSRLRTQPGLRPGPVASSAYSTRFASQNHPSDICAPARCPRPDSQARIESVLAEDAARPVERGRVVPDGLVTAD